MRARTIVPLCLAAIAAGCYEHTYTIGTGAQTGPLVYDHWQNHWLGGLIGEEIVDISEICPSGNATIHDEQTFLNGLVSALTVGIYTPTEVKSRCRGGRSGQLELDKATVRRIVAAPVFLERVEEIAPERLQEAINGATKLQEELDRL